MFNIITDIEKIWFDDITELIKKENILQIFPNKNFTINKNINSIMRLAIYISLILCIVYKNLKYLFIIVFAMIVTHIYYSFYKPKEFFYNAEDEYDAIKSKPYNPLANKLLGESNSKYEKKYLISNDEDIKKNILYKYNKIRAKMTNTNISDDLLNTKESLLGFYPLADKTGIPNFAEFAWNTYGTIIEDRVDLIARGYLSKADTNRINDINKNSNIQLDYDPLNIESIGTKKKK